MDEKRESLADEVLQLEADLESALYEIEQLRLEKNRLTAQLASAEEQARIWRQRCAMNQAVMR